MNAVTFYGTKQILAHPMNRLEYNEYRGWVLPEDEDGSDAGYLVAGSHFTVNREPLLSMLGEGAAVDYNPHIYLKNPDGSISTWSPSNGDVLADDWQIVETS